MSRAFVKEQDGPGPEHLPDRPLSSHANYVTPSGLARLKQALAEALEQRRTLTARADDMDAQSDLAALDRELRWLQARVGSAIVIEPSGQPRDRVAFGARVTVADASGEHVYRIVGEDEAGLDRNWVSYVSPLARALLGARVGQEVTWQRPAGDRVLEVLEIAYDAA